MTEISIMDGALGTVPKRLGGLAWFGLVWFGLVNIFYRYTQLNDQTVLFQTIQFKSTKLNGSKYCYV